MAGSFAHIDDEGVFTMDCIENMGDAWEALEECHSMVLRLRSDLSSATGRAKNAEAIMVELGAEVRRLRCPFAGLIGPAEHKANGCCS